MRKILAVLGILAILLLLSGCSKKDKPTAPEQKVELEQKLKLETVSIQGYNLYLKFDRLVISETILINDEEVELKFGRELNYRIPKDTYELTIKHNGETLYEKTLRYKNEHDGYRVYTYETLKYAYGTVIYKNLEGQDVKLYLNGETLDFTAYSIYLDSPLIPRINGSTDKFTADYYKLYPGDFVVFNGIIDYKQMIMDELELDLIK